MRCPFGLKHATSQHNHKPCYKPHNNPRRPWNGQNSYGDKPLTLPMKRIKNLEKYWAESFTKYLPKLQCDTFQRVESMHARIKRVLHEQLCFYQLAVAISETIDGQAAKRQLEDALSIQRNLVNLSPELSALAGLIPISLLGEIQDLYTFVTRTMIPVL